MDLTALLRPPGSVLSTPGITWAVMSCRGVHGRAGRASRRRVIEVWARGVRARRVRWLVDNSRVV